MGSFWKTLVQEGCAPFCGYKESFGNYVKEDCKASERNMMENGAGNGWVTRIFPKPPIVASKNIDATTDTQHKYDLLACEPLRKRVYWCLEVGEIEIIL